MEHITLIEKDHEDWQAVIGESAVKVLNSNNITGKERERILEEAVSILKSCGNPQNKSNNDTGLVIGYVQSGKTLSFTTLAALAAENGFNIIVVIAGTTKKLVNQTHERLNKDLDIENTTKVSWKPHKNPTKSSINELVSDLKKGILNPNPVLLITVMKNNTHLRKLLNIFKDGLNHQDPKVLFIDDEADQASLNTKASKRDENEISATYDTIRKLKSNVKNHTYIQYTATPQAPLFISILDILSPSFVKLLTPGENYTGGKQFFKRNKNSVYPYVEIIPNDEILTNENIFTQIPKSLVESVMLYYLTVVIGALEGERPQTHNRTMMVHPSQLTMIHSTYKIWLDKLKERLLDELKLSDSEIDKINLITEFSRIYEILAKNSNTLPSFKKIIPLLTEIIEGTPVIMSNSKVKQDINWKKHYSLILVGGQVLDRGFTVEGLNITYMPRSIGVGNADTIQQRCRFFGYKKNYIDMCKIYLPRDSRNAYRDYILHEEYLRERLSEFIGTNQNLKEFKRLCILSPQLNLTRRNVISDDINRYRMFKWRSFKKINDNINFNNTVVKTFLNQLNFEQMLDLSDNTRESQIHEGCIIPASKLLDKFLLELQYKDVNNSILLNHLISLISIFSGLEGDMQNIKIINMSQGRERARSVDNNNCIKNLFQGANAKTRYNGDREIKSDLYVTIQIHHVKIKNTNKSFRTFAFNIPKGIAQNIITID